MILLSLQLYDSPGGNLLLDLHQVEQVELDHVATGFHSLACFIPLDRDRSFYYYDLAPGKWLILSYGAGVAWEGRIEDREVVAHGLELVAYGAWRSFYDAPYTALWSKVGSADWRPLTDDDYSSAAPERYEIDNNNRLYIAPRKNELINSGSHGTIGYMIPDKSDREIAGIEFDYELDASSDYELRLQTRDQTWTGTGAPWILTGTGSLQSGSVHVTFTTDVALSFRLYDTVGATYSGETGATYAKITNVRLVTATDNEISTTTTTTITAGADRVVTPASMTGIYVGQRLYIDAGSATSESVTVTAVTASTFTATFANSYSGTTTIEAFAVYADEIIKALVSHIRDDNSSSLASSTALIWSPGLDLTDEIYLDAWPGDIALKLAGLGDDSTPPDQWQISIWEDRIVRFLPAGSFGRTWSIDVPDHEVNATLESLRNSVYAVYDDAGGFTRRTTAADDQNSQVRYTLTRRLALGAETTSSAVAGVIRDAALNDQATIKPRGKVKPTLVASSAGACYPFLWLVRPGDTLSIRNLQPTQSSDIDRIRTFQIGELAYNWLTDELEPTPESPAASLDVLLARREEGIG